VAPPTVKPRAGALKKSTAIVLQAHDGATDNTGRRDGGTGALSQRLRPAKSPEVVGQMIGDRQTLSIDQACEQVGVSRRTIYNWMAGGKVEYVRTAGGSVRIFVDTLWRQPNEARKPVPGGRRIAVTSEA
jgi:excisionase family DNA binding protein